MTQAAGSSSKAHNSRQGQEKLRWTAAVHWSFFYLAGMAPEVRSKTSSQK
jgi:hypothetical protein